MIDTHCHLNFNAFKDDFDEVVKRALTAGVHTIINTGTQVSSSQWAVELAEQYAGLYAIIGIHPHHADKVEPDYLQQLERLAQHPKVIGIGEIGMDYFEYASNGIVDPQTQRKIFIEQLELAHQLKLPLQIHSRDDKARKETIKILETNKNLLQNVPGMFHCMAGSLESLKAALDLGFYMGFDGNSMYDGLPPNEPLALRELINYTPLERIVIETDSPYLTPPPNRGKRNEPANAPITAQFIANLKHVSFEELVEQTDKNVYTVFKKLKNHD
ncbi:MAG TPA: TatD family hydrolase [Patescibacteria group bacterium]